MVSSQHALSVLAQALNALGSKPKTELRLADSKPV